MATWRAARWAMMAVFLVGCGATVRGARAQEAPAAAPEAKGEVRTWTDITGKFSREAEFLKLEDGKVWLRLPSGKETKIPLKELSKKDRDWVRANGAPKGAGGAKGVATRIVLRSYEALVADSLILSQSLQQQALAGAIPGFFVALTGGKPLEGFDIKKPIVITIHVDSRGQPSGGMVAVPVTSKETFQKTLDAVFPAKTSPKGRAYEVAMLGRSVYAKPGETYFLLSDSADIVRSAQADPEAPLVVADVSVESMLAAVPEDLRRAGLAQWESAMASLPVDPAEPAAQRRSREVTAEWMKKALTAITTDGDRSTFEASLDPATKRLSVAFGLRARSGTPLADSFAEFGALRPRFAAAETDALGWVGLSLPTGDWLRMFLEESLGSGIAGMQAAAARVGAIPPEGREMIAEVERQSRQLMKAEYLEHETVLSADASGVPRVLMRFAIDGVEDFFQAVVRLMTSDPAVPIVPDADGIVAAPVTPEGAAMLGPLGSQPVRLGSSKGTMIVGLGCPDTAPLKALLRPASAGAPSTAAPISARVDLAKLWPSLAAMNEATAGLATVVGESGTLRADVNGLADGVELRVSADEGVLKLLGAAGAAVAAAQGPGLPGLPGAPGFPGGEGGGFGGPPPGFPPAGGPGSPAAGGVPKRRLGVAPAEGGAPPTTQGFPTPPIPQPNQPQPPAP